jgi:fructokinase
MTGAIANMFAPRECNLADGNFAGVHERLTHCGESLSLCIVSWDNQLRFLDAARCRSPRSGTFLQARSEGCIRICDVKLRAPFCSPQVLARSLSHATILKVCEEELQTVFALLREAETSIPTRPASPQEAAQLLRGAFSWLPVGGFDLRNTWVPCGDARGREEPPGFRIQSIDPVGAGDAFTAGLVCAYLWGGSLSAIAEAGNPCGSYVAFQPGATS